MHQGNLLVLISVVFSKGIDSTLLAVCSSGRFAVDVCLAIERGSADMNCRFSSVADLNVILEFLIVNCFQLIGRLLLIKNSNLVFC